MKKRIFVILMILMLLLTSQIFAAKKNLLGKDPKTPVSLELLLGYAAPINASYIDTYQNDDIYWNPNGGFNLDMRITIQLHELVWFSLPLDMVFGYYQYTTTDGRKVNTEAALGNAPVTTNTEWSVAHNFTPMVYVKPHKHPAVPYIAIGIGVGILWSFETWEYTNFENYATKLTIAKYYLPNPSFKGEIGWMVPITKRLQFRFASTFNLVNFIMIRVQLTSFTIDGEETIKEWDEQSTIYNYAFNAPDENKGGECLLAGFTYQNYPQQKIGMNISFKAGLSFLF